MAAIPLPNKGQPLDISYLSQMADEINKLNVILSSGNRRSFIEYDESNIQTPIDTSKLVFYASTTDLKYSPTNLPSNQVTFNNLPFKKTPIITATVEVLKNQDIAFVPIITSINQGSCVVKIYGLTTPTTTIELKVSIIAIGEPQ